ncbi:MAG: sensor hybrid histidine kinase [Pedosphaera sp.]|nr:sensor hybrid histidine kinase [Pedosphaera sp.]
MKITAMENKTETANQKHILVVDDNVELAQTYQELFQVHGYKATIATNGVQALKLVMHSEVDAILCDLSMPQLEGDMFFITVERVRPHLSKRFVFVTGNVGNPKYEPFLKNVSCPVLYKPVAIDNLLKALSSVLVQPSEN